MPPKNRIKLSGKEEMKVFEKSIIAEGQTLYFARDIDELPIDFLSKFKAIIDNAYDRGKVDGATLCKDAFQKFLDVTTNVSRSDFNI